MYDSRKPLWVNISLLMHKRYGSENLNRLAREAEVSPATASRLKAQQTSVGLDTIDRLAAYFGVQPHELIRPEFNPEETPTALSPLAVDLGRMLDDIKDPVQHQRAYALALQLIQFGLMSRSQAPGSSAQSDQPVNASAADQERKSVGEPTSARFPHR